MPKTREGEIATAEEQPASLPCGEEEHLGMEGVQVTQVDGDQDVAPPSPSGAAPQIADSVAVTAGVHENQNVAAIGLHRGCRTASSKKARSAP